MSNILYDDMTIYIKLIQKTRNRKQKTENRKQKTEYRIQKTETIKTEKQK